MKTGDRIVVFGRICRFVEIVYSAWDGAKVIYTNPKGYLDSVPLNQVRVPRRNIRNLEGVEK